MASDPTPSIGSRATGYPCPKDGTTLVLIDAIPGERAAGAWCRLCHTVWRETDEVSLSDLDALPTTEADHG